MSKRIQKQSTRMTDTNGQEYYVYQYEVHKEDQTEPTIITVKNKVNRKYPNRFQTSNTPKVLEYVQIYLTSNAIPFQTLYKRKNLDSHLNGIIAYIVKSLNLKITQVQLRDLIRKHILGL